MKPKLSCYVLLEVCESIITKNNVVVQRDSPLFDNKFHFVRCKSASEALEKTKKSCLEKEQTYNNSFDETVTWKSIDVFLLADIDNLLESFEGKPVEAFSFFSNCKTVWHEEAELLEVVSYPED